MSHLSDDELVLLYYGEPVHGEAEAHARACADCGERRRALADALSAVPLPDVPVRDETYAATVWERLEPHLAAAPAPRRASRWSPRRALVLSALAASLLAAFWLGRSFPGRSPETLAPAVRERILLVAVGEHLERSQMVLVELTHAGGDGAADVSDQRAWADELVSANRLYRQSAARAGETGLAGVLEELERVLVEVAAGPDRLAPAELAELQRRIDSRGILFKVRVVGSQVRERGRDALPPDAAQVF